jgi:hypothetical protein
MLGHQILGVRHFGAPARVGLGRDELAGVDAAAAAEVTVALNDRRFRRWRLRALDS